MGMTNLLTLLVLCIGCCVGQDNGHCPRGWHSYLESCYLLIGESYDWFGAKVACDTVGAKMIKIDDEAENNFVVSLMNNRTGTTLPMSTTTTTTTRGPTTPPPRTTTTLKRLFARSIPACTDSHEYCGMWAGKGECMANRAWMTQNCRMSCNTCGVTLPPGVINNGAPATLGGGCTDSAAHCVYWAAHGECQKNPAYMLSNCRVSCHTCGVTGITVRPTGGIVTWARPADGTVSNIWLGTEDIVVEGEFRWMADGSGVEWSNWKAGEPNDSDSKEDCVEMDSNGKWNDIDCEGTYKFGTVCESSDIENIVG